MGDMIIPDQSHPLMPPKMRPASAVKAVDHLLKMTKEKSMWEVIDFIISIWAKKEDLVKEYDKEKALIKATRANEFASNKEMNLRYMAEIPVEIMDVLDMFYKDKIDEMGKKKFWTDFCKKYPYFQIADKL